MFKQRQGAFLGKKFEWYYPHSRKDLKKIAQRAIPDFRFSWKINKKTEFVVPGIDAPQDQLDEAKDRGLEVIEFTSWLGEDIGAEAETIADYLGLLVEQGFVMNTHCNEADGSGPVVTIPLLMREERMATSAAHIAKVDTFGYNDQRKDVENTLVDWVRAHHLDRFDRERDYSNYPDQRMNYSPDNDGEPAFWVKPTAATGSADHGSLYLDNETRALPVDMVERRLEKMANYCNFCFRASDAPVRDNVTSLILLGGLEPDQTTVSFIWFEMIHT
jgi:hypothetical protein